ncbi:MAG: SMC-Scp complex subunit ScpB [Rubrivivax sp.]|nr:SMC-Scp complex subunit ScpB [Pyrinomonadaceae bacterium]
MSKRRSTETVERVETTDSSATAEDSATRGEAVAELSDAIESLDDGVEGLDVEAEDGDARAGWTKIDPAGTTADDEDDLDGEDGESEEREEGEESDTVIHDADAEDRAEELARSRADEPAASDTEDDEIAPGGQPRELAELVSICEALIFVSEEPLPVKALADVLREDKGWVQVACEELAKEFNERGGGLMLREVAGGWQLATRPEHHEHIRAFLKSKPSAKLSIAALETLAVIAYKQPVTVPEILEIRGVQSSSAIKTLLDKRLIVSKGRKETVGRPMMYGTSKEFLLQFGLRDLSELPNVEDFEDLAAGGEA